MLQFPAIHHFIFHGRYDNSSVKKCQYYYGLINIFDYDGYANSDKRYKTKYDDDLAESGYPLDSGYPNI